MCLTNEEENENHVRYNRHEIVTQYLENVTVHGVSKIHRSTAIHTRCFWIVSVSMVIGFLFYQLSLLFYKLHGNGMHTQIDMSLEKGIRFPTITFCNANSFNREKIEAMVDWKPSDVLQADTSLLLRLGQQPEEAFEPGVCRFGGSRYCSYEEDFALTPTYTEGNCFTFNKNGSLRQEQPGILFGLYVVLNIEQDQHLDADMTDNMHVPDGWYVSLHEPTETSDVTSRVFWQEPAN